MPWSAFDETLLLLREAGAKRVVSVVVPWTGNDEEPAAGRDDSVAERFGRGLPNAAVAGAFTTVAAATIRGLESYAEVPTIFVAANDADTKRSVREFAESLGFDSLDADRCTPPALRGRWASSGRRRPLRAVPAR